ncbi:hypothetical protein MRB53_040102 [Persea americana]|nr:hypothetical protein MRB53_040102 [Persea americana]
MLSLGTEQQYSYQYVRMIQSIQEEANSFEEQSCPALASHRFAMPSHKQAPGQDKSAVKTSRRAARDTGAVVAALDKIDAEAQAVGLCRKTQITCVEGACQGEGDGPRANQRLENGSHWRYDADFSIFSEQHHRDSQPSRAPLSTPQDSDLDTQQDLCRLYPYLYCEQPRRRTASLRSPPKDPSSTTERNTGIFNPPCAPDSTSAVEVLFGQSPTFSKSLRILRRSIGPWACADQGRSTLHARGSAGHHNIPWLPQGTAPASSAVMAAQPSGAADLLRQAMMQSSGRPHEDDVDHDQIGSDAPTPQQPSTPQPDPQDKRFPSIVQSYFGQVRASVFPSSKRTTAPPVPDTNHSPSGQEMDSNQEASALPTAPPTPSTHSDRDERTAAASVETGPAVSEGPAPPSIGVNYPTPPLSASRSFGSDVAFDEKHHVESIAKVDYNLDSTMQKPPTAPASRRSSRPGAAVAPLTSISPSAATVGTSHVSGAGHIVSPTNPSSPFVAPRTPPTSANALPVPPESRKLTGVASPPRKQTSTPPHSPRSTAQSSRRASRTSSPSIHSRNGESHRAHRDGTAAAIAVKGRLSVTIAQARGLKPSIEPYVVCEFQRNEDISGGPQAATPAPDSGTITPTTGMPMRRTDSETGRPVAIPMRSRQSSHTSITVRANKTKEVTDPVWNHDAVL